MVKGFPEAVAVVPEVRLEGHGQRVTLGLEHQSAAIILLQRTGTVFPRNGYYNIRYLIMRI